jgi:tRNA dimethylallyltransferase
MKLVSTAKLRRAEVALKNSREYAKKIGPRDKVRITRALEVIYSTGKPFSQFHRDHPFFQKKRYNILKIGLILPRGELYQRINQRVIKMIEAGWIEEVKALLEKGYNETTKAFKAIGYRHILRYLKGELTLEEAIRLIQRDTRHYAKRQLTWFKKEPGVHWFSPYQKEEVLSFVKKSLGELENGEHDRIW